MENGTDIFMQIINNKCLYVPAILWLGIQVLKIVLELATTKKLNYKRIFGAGGMPSAHSAVVSVEATLIGRTEGFDSALFALAVILAFVVMYDAAGVRRAAGNQAKVLNKIVNDQGMQIDEEQEKLVEFLGHTPVQVMVGAAIGIVFGAIV